MKMMGRGLLAAIAFLAMAGTSSADVSAVFGGADPLEGVYDRQNQHFVDLVNERGAGQIKLEFIRGEQLGNDVQVIEQVMSGAVQFYGDDFSFYSNWVPELNIVSWGFLFRDNAHVQAYIESDSYKNAIEKLRAEQGIRVLAAAPGQVRVMVSSRPIKGVKDLAGLKMRVPEIRTYLTLWETLGTAPARVAWGETFLGLSTGVVEGAEGGISSIYGAKFHEAAKNVTRTDHVRIIAHIAVNDAWFQSQTPEIQELLTKAAQDAVIWQMETVTAEQAETLDKMAADGATVTEIDVTPLRERSEVAVEKLEAEGFWPKGLWAEIQAMD
ncbi:TRAP transporter substrate-binding protein [Rhizobium sp. TRM96647]|uniref:TRAP transporter substrate-binding protein n=1 Tax=unclassified Rhizobium TaxID=2613769 RepID=UPI0021E8A414|nr:MULTISPECIES: TRAP transporter substrate-binding protein [unclassified Rhizobium]MCV3738837.1 TRAP transporter substrate-binding protein [Rhizobium sp. TRM96647]MCV3760456.1 TRAP transporter substrate-binding protein [Rhizobium sp. TRM96650]